MIKDEKREAVLRYHMHPKAMPVDLGEESRETVKHLVAMRHLRSFETYSGETMWVTTIEGIRWLRSKGIKAPIDRRIREWFHRYE